VERFAGGDAIVASENIQSVEEMSGRTVAVSMPASQWLLEYTLKNSSLTEVQKDQIKKNRHKTQGSREALEEFVSGKADVAVLWEPNVSQALDQREGAHILMDSTIATNLIADVMIAKQEFIRERPDVIKAFIKGWFEGTARATNDPMLAVKILQRQEGFASLSETQIRKLLGKVAWTTMRDNVQMFGLAGQSPVFDQLFNGANSLWYDQHYITERVAAEKAREIGPLREIHSAMEGQSGGANGYGDCILTRELSIPFPPKKAELTIEAQRMLDSADISLLLQAHPTALFCVEVTTDEGPNHNTDLNRARADVVIEYLARRYDHPRNRFRSAGTSESVGNRRAEKCIRLKLIKWPGDQETITQPH